MFQLLSIYPLPLHIVNADTTASAMHVIVVLFCPIHQKPFCIHTHALFVIVYLSSTHVQSMQAMSLLVRIFLYLLRGVLDLQFIYLTLTKHVAQQDMQKVSGDDTSESDSIPAVWDMVNRDVPTNATQRYASAIESQVS